MEKTPIYLDYNATTPLDPEVIEKVTESLRRDWANPSSSYERGQRTKDILGKARLSVSNVIGGPLEKSLCDKSLTFTSGGTEANALAIFSAVEFYRQRNSELNGSEESPHVVTTNIEHPAIEIPLKTMEKEGKISVTFVDVQNGRVEVNDILDALQPNTCLVTVMMANNETGVIQPIAEIAAKIRHKNKKKMKKIPILVHTDAAQAVGKIPVNVEDLQVDYLTIAGHKFYGPRIGALYHDSVSGFISPMFRGGSQEFSRRSGTENVPMIVGLGAAADVVARAEDVYTTLSDIRAKLERGLISTLGQDRVQINFADRERLPNTCSVSFTDISSGRELLNNLKGLIDASTSAACHSQGDNFSTLVKSGLPVDVARKTVRLSVGKNTTEGEIHCAIKFISKALNI